MFIFVSYYFTLNFGDFEFNRIILLKGKGKKTKKNKMLKVDARNILGFSVTAAEDRINVGDIDTA